MNTSPGIRCVRNKWTPTPGLWDFDGACKPGSAWGHYHTFSVGVFQWVVKASGRGVKRAKVVKRISGPMNNPEAVYAAAETYIAAMEVEAGA